MTLHLKMNGQPAGEGGFSAAGGPRHQHDMLVLPADPGRDLAERALMQGLVHADKIPEPVLIYHRRNIRHVPDSQDIAPPGALLEDRQMLRPVQVGRRVVMIRACRQLKHEAAP